jgi:hypothetical protein
VRVEEGVMAKTSVYRAFEVCDGFGPRDVGPKRFESEWRGDADAVLELLAGQGSDVQLFGIKSHDESDDGERVLLRMLVGRRAA